ncbi:MAG: hypothetical protein D6776_04420 [Planctomycetota bacterium]|nr:MAG: hypothetical protein D6776_04420 [Planctomycetota bacterium]
MSDPQSAPEGAPKSEEPDSEAGAEAGATAPGVAEPKPGERVPHAPWPMLAATAAFAGLALGVALGYGAMAHRPPVDTDTVVRATRHAGSAAHRPQQASSRRRPESTPSSHDRSSAAPKHAPDDAPADATAVAARAAATAFAEGRYRVARSIYLAALDNPQLAPTAEAEIRAGLAACYSRLGARKEAIEQAARAADLLLAEGNGEQLIRLGDRLLERGNDVGARRRYARVLLTADGPWSDTRVEALAELRLAAAWAHAASRAESAKRSSHGSPPARGGYHR